MKRRCLLHHASREEGQAIVTLALMSVFLMMILAIALETGFIWIQKRNLQTAADAAALAGAQELDGTSVSEGPAITAANDYATRNVTGLVSNSATVENGYRTVRAEVSKNAETVFASWFGFGGFEIEAHAVAQIAAPLWPGPGVVPLTIDLPTFELCADPDTGDPLPNGECADVTLKEYAGNNDDPPSSYGLLDLGGNGGGANEVCEYLIGGSDVAITDPTDEQNGNVSSLHNCLIERIQAAQDGPDDGGGACLTWSQVTEVVGGETRVRDRCNPLIGAGRGSNASHPNAQPTAVVLIPIIDSFIDTCGAQCLDIVGDGDELRLFAYFWINPEATVLGDDPSCEPPAGGGGNGNGNGNGGGNGAGQCHITGDFILDYRAFVSTDFDIPTGEFDPELSLLKVIQLIE